MASAKPFLINIPQRRIDILKQKLSLTEFPEEIRGAKWNRGCPLSEMERLIKAWKDWDWRAAEVKLNKVPQFQIDIEVADFGTLDIHFIHQRSKIKGAIPLLFVHGWPGSFIEVLKIIQPLTNQFGSSPSFHIVAPSLPNFGFSQGITKPGFALPQYAETCNNLMHQLGYDEYVTQAGDWGFWITRSIGRLYPESCKASHYNMIYTKAPSFKTSPSLAFQNLISLYDENDKKELRELIGSEKKAESTKPQTLAYGLHDSPVGLLAWIYEKLHDWSDEYPWTDDEILTWISIYWFSRAGPGAAANIYYEVFHAAETKNDPTKSLTYEDMLEYTPKVKLGLTYNPKDLEMFPKLWGNTLGNVVYMSENEKGGHFYAHEYPMLLVNDIQAMFGKHSGAYGAVSGKDGYEE